MSVKEKGTGDFSGGPVAKTLAAMQGGPGLIPSQETRSHTLQLPQLKIPMSQ